ncbi:MULTISPECIES: Gfo/Idh/MocA family oxidoreductase [unclassified Streptomyces]|uniref:Gfo/Idh/MocA family protein n=1 Tax=Streptomyces sp. DvalAA-19 TaxID=1839761 RepID=UPI00081BB055|nr:MULTISPECIES: Gfo/Idh/MocA family oxidoreductase [unclassified Streptomyces]RST25372.1 gfo/Idh/MocA family oxidoreductase [Streptomyces sp. WAC04770]SCD81853.1 Predicted dehydrogenase [Streptomyces sp. DvalAA-19]
MSTVRVVLAGAHGFGRNYLPPLRELAAEGRAELVGVCDLKPVDAGWFAGLGRPDQSADLSGLIRRHAADLAVVATPLHTHVPLAAGAMAAGAHVQLEKPPAPSMAGYLRLLADAEHWGRAVQVGFQSLGSTAPEQIRELIGRGAVGRLRCVSAAAAWSRDTSYYERAPWAGRRRLSDGTDVVDGALTNPLAHAVATVMAVAGGSVETVEVELYRAFDIEADDTSCVRVVTRGGLAEGVPLVIAATLAAPEQTPPVITVTGDEGRLRYWYTEDRIRLERADHTVTETVGRRTVLLRHLVEQLQDGGQDRVPRPLVPLSSVRSFMEVLEAVRNAPEPVRLPAQDLPGRAGSRRRVLPWITDIISTAAERGALFSELPDFAAAAGRQP